MAKNVTEKQFALIREALEYRPPGISLREWQEIKKEIAQTQIPIDFHITSYEKLNVKAMNSGLRNKVEKFIAAKQVAFRVIRHEDSPYPAKQTYSLEDITSVNQAHSSNKSKFQERMDHLAGASIYRAARKAGMDPVESFAFSTGVSNFLWPENVDFEDMENIAKNSGLAIVFGEIAYNTANHIRNNDGRLAGSKPLGQIVMLVADPSQALEDAALSISKRPLFESIDFGFASVEVPRYEYELNPSSEHTIGIHMKIHFHP